jgi:hypothetical protein
LAPCAYEARRFLFLNSRTLTLRCDLTCNDALARMHQRLASQGGQLYLRTRPPRSLPAPRAARFYSVVDRQDRRRNAQYIDFAGHFASTPPADGVTHWRDPFAIFRDSIRARDRSF